MYILFEDHEYESEQVGDILKDIYVLQDVNRKVSLKYVGYFYNPHLKDCVFILPKVLLMDKDGREVLADVTLSNGDDATPENVLKPEDQEKLSREYRKFIYEFSVWIYRAISVFHKANPESRAILFKQLPQSGKGRRSKANTYLDIVLSLIAFNRENRDFVLFTVRNLHKGNNKINWTRTIAHSTAIVQDDSAAYLNLVNRKRVANYEEELFVIFYSILNFLNTEYGFNAPINIQYELIKGRQFDQYRNGLGRTRLMQIKYRYFSDKTLQLWDLCYSFFDCTHSIALNTNSQEYLLAKSFHVVFEAMIDELIGTPHNQIPKGLADQEDGKRVDHIYMDLALTSENGQNDREIYYIGDSKYYKSKNSLSSESIYKQYTYARNVVQWNVNLFLGEKADFDDYRSDDREGPFGNTRLQSESTEGYDVIPNFFISAFVDGNRRYNSGRNIERHREPGKDKSEKHCTYMQYQFEDRLFDRDTLFLSHYDVNFLYVLYLYARNRASEKAQWKKEVRKMFRDEIRSVVQQRFEIYAMQPHSEVDGDEYIRMHFYELNGRVFKPYGENRGTFLAFAGALDGSGQLKDESRELKDMLEKHFFIAKCDMGEDPEDKINEAKASMKDAPAMEVEPENYLTLHWLEKYTGQSVLLGFYKSAEHLDWILSNKKYNVRLKKRNEEGREGSHIKSEYESHNVKFAILYGGDYTQTGRYRVFEVRNTATAMKSEEMEKLGYPNPQGSYLVYSLDEEVSLGKLDIRSMLHNLETEHVQTASRMDIDAPAYEPIFVKAEQLKQYRKSLI